MAIKITNLDSIKGSGVKNPKPLRQNWYSGDSPTTRDVLGRISEIYDHNKLAGTFYSNQFFKLQQDSSSPFYDPYASATNKAVNELASYGVDTSVIDDKFFADNDYLRSYLNYNGSTNTPSAPGKKASTAEKAAYAFYQIWKSEDKTKKAESQWNALQDELAYWAKRTDRNYTDDEIINKVDWSKYGELTSMDTNKLMQPNEYNRAIGYSKDAMYGVIWAARNNGGTGDVFSDMAMSARGKGNTWQYNPEISAKLDPQNEQFLPYALGSTNLDDEAYLFGVPSFSKEWIAQNNGLQYEDSEKGRAFRKVMSAENDTVSAETALEGLNKWIDQNKSKWDTQEEAQAALDKVLAKGTLTIGKGNDKTQYDLSILNRIDATIGKNGEAGTGNLIAFNRPIDYKYDNVVRGFSDIVTENNQIQDGSQTANNLADDITFTEPEPVKAPETKTPSANDEIDAVSGAGAAVRKPGDQTGVRTPTDLAPVNYTDSEIEQIRVKDKKISEASGIVDDVATENESTVMKNAGSVAFFGNKDRFSWIRNNAVSNQRFADGLTNISAKNLMSEGLGKAHSVAEYSNVEANYAADQQLFNQYRQKYGDLQYLQKEFKPTMTLTLEGADGDTYNVTLTYQDMNKGYQISDVVNTNYVFGESESGNDPGIYEQANAIAREQTAEAKKILYAQKNVHDNYGEAGEKEVEEYKALSARIHNEESYLAVNKEANDQNIVALKKSIEKMEMQYDAMTKEGLDTSGIKRSYDLLNNVLNYHDEPQLPRSTMTKLQYADMVGQLVGEEYDTEKKSELLHRSINNVDEKIRQIQDDIDYAKAQGIEIPERYLRNMELTIRDLEVDKKGFEYSTILTDTKQEELDAAIEAGKEFEQYVIDNVLIDDNIIHPAYGFEHLQQVATEEDQKIYYYLLGKQVLEHGDEYQALLHSNNPDDVLTKSGELMESIMKDSSDYLDFMLDDDYGVWTSRRAEANKEEAKAMVDSGFGGGLIANVASTLLTPVESLSSALYMLDRALGDEQRINPDSKFRSISNFKESTRAETRASIDEYYKNNPTMKYIANLGYEIYCNRGDSVMNALLTGSIFHGEGFLSELAGSSPMGATAALTAAANAIDKGASTEQAWAIAGVTFLAETMTEAVTYSNILGAFGVKEGFTKRSLKDFTIEWLTRSGVEELVGETTNDVIENWADRMVTQWFNNPNYESEHQQLVDSYYAQGYTGEGEAEAKALEEEMKGYLHTAFVSYLSAGTDVMIKTGKSLLNSARTAGQVVDSYRSYTKARQKVGFGESMFDYMRQDVRDAMASRNQTTQEASVQEAGVAVPSETVEATPEQKQAAADVTALGRVEGSAQTAQTEMVASVLDDGEGDAVVSDQANAAATFMPTVLGNDSTFVIQQVITGASRMGIDQATVKTALRNAALGNGAATAVVQSEQFQNASPEQKAQMLAGTVEQDQNNPDVQQNIAAKVNDFRSGMVINDLAAQGHFDQAQQAQDKADAAAVETAKAETQLQEKQDALDEATRDVEQKAQAVAENPTDDNMKQHADAVTRADNADESRKQYEEHLAKQQEAQKEADAKAQQAKDDAMTSARETASQTVAQQDQQRQVEAEAIAEQQRQEAEAAAQAQAQQDEMTGKADEDRRAALVEQLLDNENLQGEERDARREKLMNQLDKVKVKITDLKQSVSNTEGRLALYAFERKLGIPIQFADLGPVDSQRITRGKYENGTIYLNENLIKSGKMTVGQALVEASLHEIIHSVRNTNAYNSYRNVVMNALYGARNSDNAVSMYNENSDYRAAIDTMIADRAAAGDPNFTGDDLNRMIEIADEEIVADFARMNLAEKDVVQRLMDAGMGGKMRNTLHNINQALKNYFGNLTGEERRTAETLRRAERNLQKAINEAAETSVHPEGGQFSISQFAQSAGLNFDQNTLVLTDQNGNVIDGVNNKVTADMMNNTPVGLLIDLARDGAKAQNGNVKFESTISAETAQAQKQMFADLMNMVAQYKDSDLVWEIASSTMFSALKSNSDPQYSTTVDFGTVCAKTQEIINVMSQVMLEKGRGLTREEVLKVYNETANANLTVPCPVCYVFSRWMGVPSLLNQMSQYQKRFVALNDDGSINMEKTGENANTYIKSALEKYGSKDKIDDAKVSLVNRMKTQEKNRAAALAVLNSETATAEEKAKAQTKHDEAIKNLDNLQKELGEVEAYNWVTQALCLQQQKGKTKYNVLDKNGNYVIDPSFELTPDNVLFDLRQTGEFAKYTKNWQYRNTRGAGMGKAIMPYSGESIGDIIYGTNRKSEIMNPFLTQTYAKAADGIKNAINRAKQQNLIGGQRLQSTSDFRPEWGLDYMMAFLELQAVGSKVQMYTKVAEAVDLLASMGGDINLSIMGKGQGWHVDENGNQVLDFSDVTGMDYETAKALKDQYDNVQMILVGMNDTHIKLALANPDIDFVIPWHSSGNSKDTLASLVSSASQGEEQLETSSDYTDTQSDKESENQTEDQKKLWNLRMKILQGQKLTEADRQIILADDYLKPLYERFTVKGKDDDCYKVKLAKDQAKQIFPYEYWNKSLTKDQANANGQAFIDYCQHFGIVPRFSGVVKTNDDGTFSVTGNFAGAIYDENGNITGYDPNQMYDGYWKVLIDRPMYDNKGNYRDQQVVDVTKAKIGTLENGKLTNSDMPLKTSAMYGPNYSTQEKTAVDNSLVAIEQMEQARMNGGKQSVMGDLTAADQDLMTDAVNDYADAVARGDTEAAQEDVDFYAEQKGFTTEDAFHGTLEQNFTEFDFDISDNEIFVSYTKSLSQSYVPNNEDVRQIKDIKRDTQGALITKLKHMTPEEQISYITDDLAEQFAENGFSISDSRINSDGKAEILVTVGDESEWTTIDNQAIYGIAELIYPEAQKNGAGLYRFYTRPGNQLVIEANGAQWNAIPFDRIDPEKGTATTREIADWAKANGYDSVRINDCLDWGGHGPEENARGDIGIFFNKEDVRSADPVTYDDKGNVIPLDQRFSENPDFRYSVEGELTEADRDLMTDAGLDSSAEERINRQIEQHDRVREVFSSWNDGSAKTVKEVLDLLGDVFYPLKQWLHNTYQKGSKKDILVTKADIGQFLSDDLGRIQKGSGSVVNGWANLIRDSKPMTALDVSSTKTTDGGTNKRVSNISDIVFGQGNVRGDFLNADTGAIIRLDKDTISKSFAYEGNSQFPINIKEQILSNAGRLLENSTYIGSHINYADNKGNVHYFVTPVTTSDGKQVVMFSVHDATKDNQQYSERAYVAEISLLNEKDTLGSLQPEDQDMQELRRQMSSEVSIEDMLNSVNTDRIRFFDKNALNGSKIRLSAEGELTGADRDIMEEQNLNQTLAESGALTAEEVAAYEERYHKRPLEGRRATEGEAQRAFGDVGGMLEKSDEIANFAKSVVKAQNTYFPDTNFDQINRAVDWIKSQKGGYAEALEKVTSDSFDYRSADGQARMVAMMGLAAAKNDVIAQASLADAFNRQGTDLGRALQARKLFMLMTPEGRKSTLRKMLQNAKDEMGKQGKNVDLSFSEWIYEAAAAAETQEDMRLVQQAALASLGEQLPSNWKDRLNSIRMLSMLANPRTHIRNIIGNAMFIPAVSLKNKLGAVMELGVKQGEKTKTLKPIASKEARAFAREDAETIKGLLTGEAKYSEAAQIKQNQAPLGQFMKVLSDLNSNFLESEDWFFLKGHYRRALSGWMEANGYTANQLREDQTLLEKGRAYAINEAQKATYRDFSKTAQILNSVSRKGGLPGFIVDAALPFKKTPANILRRGIEYSPAGIVKSLSYDLVKMKQYLDYQNGKLDVLPEKALSPTQVIDHICSGLSGTAITALGFLLAGSGAVSCGLDDDEDKFEKAKGNQEYAIKAKLFGHDVTFTLDWAAPMSMPFFVGAAVREQMEKEGNVNVEDAFNAFGGILEPVFNLSMLDGINTLFKTSSYDSNTNPIMQILEKIGTNYISSFVPSALGAVARTIDDTKRKSFVPSDQSKGFVGNLRYAHENAQNKIPFYNQQNIPVRDIWGNEDRTGFVERLLENFILPGYINEYKEDPIINEMARLYEATGDKSMIPQADPDKTISYTVKSTKENVKHVLTDKEWDKYKEVRGKTAFNELTDLLNNPDYQNASDATQVQMIKDIWSHANKVGQKAVIPDIDVDDSNVATIVKDSKISSTKNEMIKALNAGDYDAYDAMVQALYDEGLEESDVRAKIRDYYREQYKDAYRKGLDDRVLEIEDILDNTGIDFSDLIDNWQEAVDEEKDNSASANPDRYIASAGMSDSSFSNRTASMPERPASDNSWDQYMSDLDDYWADYDFASNDPVGQYGQGNIDLDNRQTVQNDDGSISTEQSFSFYDEQTGKEVLIPLVADGRVMTQDEAIDRYYETGEYLGMFDDWHDADEYATMLHNRQDWYYHQ